MTILFKNALIYQLTQPSASFIESLKANAEDNEFVPCGSYDALSIGLTSIVPDILDDTVASLGEVTLFAVKRQEKKIPAQALREAVDLEVEAIEEQQDRKVYRKEKLQIKEAVHARLLPNILPVSAITRGYIDHKTDLVFIDTTSTTKAEEVLNFIRDAIGSFPVKPISPTGHPAQIMTPWLKDGGCDGLIVLEEGKLSNPLDGGEAATLKNTDMQSEAVQRFVQDGWTVESLRLSHREIAFTITDDADRLKRIQWPEIVNEGDLEEMDAIQHLEADLHIMVEEFRCILQRIGQAFGGWIKQEPLKLEEEKAA